MIKSKLVAIFFAYLILASSITAFADSKNPEQSFKFKTLYDTKSRVINLEEQETLLVEHPVVMPQAALKHYPSVPLFIHDVKGNPVSGIVVDHLSNIPCTNEKGQITLDLVVPFQAFDLRLSNPVNGEYIDYRVCFQIEEGQTAQTSTLLWNKELPEDSVKKVKEKVKFRAVDQNGKPLAGVQFVFHDQRFIYPTNADGETWYWQEPVAYNYVDVQFKDEKGNDKEKRFWCTITEQQLERANTTFIFKVDTTAQ